MDHYKVLGVNRNATKEEIKDAFRKLAMQFHPDKHAHSPKSVRDGATLRFKQVSLAYEVLNDDRKRADYNLRYANGGGGGFASSGYAYGPSRGHTYGYGGGYGSYGRQNYNYSKPPGGGYGFVSKFELALRFLTTRAFLLNLAFVGAMLGGTVIVDTSREALWKMHNPGKSFEDAMESIEKAKAHKDKA